MSTTKAHLLTHHEAGDVLRMLPARVLRFAKSGELPHVKLPDGELRFVESDLWQWVSEHTSGTSENERGDG